MWFWIGAAIVVIVIILAVVLSELRVELLIRKSNQDDRIYAKVILLYGLIRLHFEVPAIMLDKLKKGILFRLDRNGNFHEHETSIGNETITKAKVRKALKDLRRILAATEGFNAWIRTTLARVSVHRMDWSTNISAGDSMYTAVTVGALWGIKTTAVGWMTHYMRFRKPPRLFVVPYWIDELRLTSEMQASLNIPVYQLIAAGASLFLRIRRVEGGFQVWKELLKEAREAKKKKRAAI
ncbi:DUF2953 domain-containing protein [Paenibacillus sp. JX-17]|uniref:DUF2953 domain-containing protein n=1 Tax=Paenibacillus lacisoli TaxID=3064525 RepID=A0ABT9CBP5_9BACL|nr:DUF2953 domain-containing protein [Paenibacillus sp. JX-17]MDO7905111.1 DUF2953 domain-containing protein [Paenibacillus sp. JX-17]